MDHTDYTPGYLHTHGAHDPSIVLVSIALAAFGAYVALDLADRAKSSSGGRRLAWLGGSALAMGGGVWAMHFTAMLAMVLPADAWFDPFLTMSSLAIAMATTGFAFLSIGYSQDRTPWRHVALGGMIMGLGVSAMHYVGMEALAPSIVTSYSPHSVLGSMGVGVVASAAGLWIAFRLSPGFLGRSLAAVLMGLAIAALHYTAMSGTSFSVPDQDVVSEAVATAAGMDRGALTAAISAVTVAILGLALAAAVADRVISRRLSRSTRELRVERDLNQVLVDACPDGIIAFDRDMVITHWSPQQERQSTIPAEAAVGRRLEEILAKIEGSKSMAAARATLLGASTAVDDSRVLDDGSTQHWFAQFSPIPGEDGAVDGGVIHVRVTTGIRQLEASLRQSQKMEAMGQLASGIVHDFNNLLQVVTSAVSLVDKGRSFDDVREPMLDAMKRGRELTQQLLGFARTRSMNPVVVDPHAHLKSSLARMLKEAVNGTAKLDVKPSPDVWLAEVDPTELDIALLNLCINARDASKDGATIRIDCANETVVHPSPYDVPEGDYVRISVQDTGSGMPPEIAARAFEPMFTTKEIGTGLGLSQVYGFARRSGGVATIHSFPGVGTTVSILVPRAGNTLTEVPDNVREGIGNGAVMVVDHNGPAREAARHALAAAGWKVTAVADCREALDALALDCAYAAVVCEGMGRTRGCMDGAGFAAEASARHPGLRVLVAVDDPFARVPDGAAGKLNRPWGTDDLSSALGAPSERPGLRVVAGTEAAGGVAA